MKKVVYIPSRCTLLHALCRIASNAIKINDLHKKLNRRLIYDKDLKTFSPLKTLRPERIELPTF